MTERGGLTPSLILLLLLLFVSLPVNAVDRSKFRRCQDTGFCKRQRRVSNVTEYAHSFGQAMLLKDSVKVLGGADRAHSRSPGRSPPKRLSALCSSPATPRRCAWDSPCSSLTS